MPTCLFSLLLAKHHKLWIKAWKLMPKQWVTESSDFYRNILIILTFVEIYRGTNDVKTNCYRYLFLLLFLFLTGYKCIIFKKNVFFKIGNAAIIILMFKAIYSTILISQEKDPVARDNPDLHFNRAVVSLLHVHVHLCAILFATIYVLVAVLQISRFRWWDICFMLSIIVDFIFNIIPGLQIRGELPPGLGWVFPGVPTGP